MAEYEYEYIAQSRVQVRVHFYEYNYILFDIIITLYSNNIFKKINIVNEFIKFRTVDHTFL